jgi:mono/diheme cytochrome c family protein
MLARRVVLVASSTLCLFSLAACSDPAPDVAASVQPPPSNAVKVALTSGSDFPTYSDTSSEVADGAQLFSRQRCAECHSDAGIILGAGNGNIDVIATAIRDGRPDGMPAYGGKLTDAQIWQLAAFVKALDTRADSETVRSGVDLTAGN